MSGVSSQGLAQSKQSGMGGCSCSRSWGNLGRVCRPRVLRALSPGPPTEPLCTRFMDFVCKNRQQCLFQSMVCDGIVQCRDGSDEDAVFAGCCEWGRQGGGAAGSQVSVHVPSCIC